MFHILTSVNQTLAYSCCKEHTSRTSSPEMLQIKIRNKYMKCNHKDCTSQKSYIKKKRSI